MFSWFIGSCDNKNTRCVEWAKRGECGKHSGWMTDNCCKACRGMDDAYDWFFINNKIASIFQFQLSLFFPSTHLTIFLSLSYFRKNCIYPIPCPPPYPESYISIRNIKNIHDYILPLDFGSGGSGGCQDKDKNCGYWAQRGYCRGSHGQWMRANCCKSCGRKYPHICYFYPFHLF